ncbi:MAG: FadR family transcriptional regulator [Solirubrobacteraceae bacterium]|nr:FadR family transcriptional regulator [Solirubrobacteraceae bacterium]
MIASRLVQPVPSSIRPTPPRLRSAAVHDRLRRAIVAGQYRPGDALPSERALSEMHRVNRHAVREAIKRLQQAGLVQVTQGGATRVLDWRETAGLDLLADLAASESFPSVMRSFAQMRATIGADAARLCALNAPAETRRELPALARAIPSPADMRRYRIRFEAYEALWSAIVRGSGNVAYRLAFNSLVGARHGGGIDPELFAAEVDDRDAAIALAAVIVAGDADLAYARARGLLQRTVDASA